MSAPVTKIEQLLALAVDPAASAEEARTAALIAARMIRSSGLQLAAPGATPVSTPSAPPAPEWKRNERPPGAYLFPSKFGGWCTQCGGRFQVGWRIWWVPSRRGAIHFACPRP